MKISHEVFERERTRYTELPRKFPFHRAKHITIRIDAHVHCNTDHVFHHMVYVCGLLFVPTKSIESLSVEIWAEDSHGRVLSCECPSWKSTGRNGFAEAFDIEEFRYWEQVEENASTKHVDNRIAFLLQPLELRKRVDKGDIVFCSPHQPSDNLAYTIDYYRALLHGKTHTSNRETNWLRTEYFSIITKRKENAKRVQQERKQHHEEWLQRIHEEYDCRHNRFKPYRRCGKNAHCEGCDRWLESLTRCRLCDMKACETCRADLREKWSALEKEKRVREGGYLLPWTRGKAGKASG